MAFYGNLFLARGQQGDDPSAIYRRRGRVRRGVGHGVLETVPEAKITRLNEKIATLRQEIQRLNALNNEMMQTEDKQIS